MATPFIHLPLVQMGVFRLAQLLSAGMEHIALANIVVAHVHITVALQAGSRRLLYWSNGKYSRIDAAY
jgi:hypothetical protein